MKSRMYMDMKIGRNTKQMLYSIFTIVGDMR